MAENRRLSSGAQQFDVSFRSELIESEIRSPVSTVQFNPSSDTVGIVQIRADNNKSLCRGLFAPTRKILWGPLPREVNRPLGVHAVW